LEGEKNLLSTHLLVSDDTDQKKMIALKKNVRERMKKKGIDHVTIEIEFESEDCKTRNCD